MEGDLRALPDLGPFDGVVSWGNSFGYVTPPETVRSLAAFRRLVKPGGRLVLESGTVAESLLVAGISEHREIEFGGVKMTSTNHYRVSESRMESEYVFESADGGGRAQPRRASRAHDRRGRADVARRRVRAGRVARRRRRPVQARLRRMIAVAS